MSENAAIAIDALSNAGMKPGSNWAMRMRRVARRQPLGVLAIVILGVLSVCALFAPVISGGADPLSMNATQVMRPPSAAHVMGTDDLGRDVFSRILYGARISLWVGFISVGISIGVGAPAGMISAYAGKWVDFGIQRIVDAMFAFPTIILALAIVSVLGAGIIQVTVAVGIVGIPRIARVARASTLGGLRSRHPCRGVSQFSRCRHACATAVVGHDAQRWRSAIRAERTVSRDLPGARDQLRGVRLQHAG